MYTRTYVRVLQLGNVHGAARGRLRCARMPLDSTRNSLWPRTTRPSSDEPPSHPSLLSLILPEREENDNAAIFALSPPPGSLDTIPTCRAPAVPRSASPRHLPIHPYIAMYTPRLRVEIRCCTGAMEKIGSDCAGRWK